MTSTLLIRVSSLGDVVQTFPAATDLLSALPEARLEWVVEESYEPLVRLHSGVARTVPFALRRWRKNLMSARTRKEVPAFYRDLRRQKYTAVIDAQGLLKSLAIAKIAHGPVHGFGPETVREAFVARFYDHQYEFPADRHRVWHYRGLLAGIFDYEIDSRIESIDYGLSVPPKPVTAGEMPYCVLLHATARAEKLWPEAYWLDLGKRLQERGITCVLPWGNADEQGRAQRLALGIAGARLMPRLSLEEAAGLLAHAHCVVGVDTGLMHLAVAYKTPVVGIYVATRPGHHGPLGAGPTAFCGGLGMSPQVGQVWDTIKELVPELT